MVLNFYHFPPTISFEPTSGRTTLQVLIQVIVRSFAAIRNLLMVIVIFWVIFAVLGNQVRLSEFYCLVLN